MNVDLGAGYTATRTGGKRKLFCSSGRCSAGAAKQPQHVVGSLDDLALAVDPAVDLIPLFHLGEYVGDGRARYAEAVGQFLLGRDRPVGRKLGQHVASDERCRTIR
jgi:hypothetical protein